MAKGNSKTLPEGGSSKWDDITPCRKAKIGTASRSECDRHTHPVQTVDGRLRSDLSIPKGTLTSRVKKPFPPLKPPGVVLKGKTLETMTPDELEKVAVVQDRKAMGGWWKLCRT
jgi:hypothetical protein